MKSTKTRSNKSIIITLVLIVFIFVGCPLTIKDLKGPNWEKYVGKSVTIEGVFVRDPLPMLVTDLDIVLVNTPMPMDQYIILTGKETEKMGPEIGGSKIKLTGVVTAVKDTIMFWREKIIIIPTVFELLEKIKEYAPRRYQIEVPELFIIPHRYAVLFSGGIDAVNNHIRYWNDLKFMYNTLISQYGYSDETIYVLYADGVGRDDEMTVDYSATQTNLQTVFDDLRNNTTSEDIIFFFATNHGGGFWPEDPYQIYTRGGQVDLNGDEGQEVINESDYNRDLNGDGDRNDQVAWDEGLCSWGGTIIDDDFPNILDDLNYKRLIIAMEQCFSGGLILDMAQSGNDIIIMSAAAEHEVSYSGSSTNDFDEWAYWFISALNWARPEGDTVDADVNDDTKISMVEAWNYARQYDAQNETPQYEDNGDGISQSVGMPASGEGTLGSNTFLK